MIRAAIARDHGATCVQVDFDAAAALVREPAEDRVVWVDAGAATLEEIATLEAVFGLHQLTVEDLTHRNQRAKLEEYPGYIFLVTHWFPRMAEAADPEEVHCALGRNWLLTVCDSSGVTPIDEAWEGFLRGHLRPPAGADGQLYRVLDTLVDAHLPILGEFEDCLERLSDAAVRDGQYEEIGDVVDARRRLVAFRRLLAPQRDVLSAIARRENALIAEKSLLYFRDVSDHLQREYESIESLRELAQSVMEVHLAVSERRQNQVVTRLTIVSTIFLPLNFVTGFFGMNFTHLPFSDDRFLAAALAAMVILPTTLVLWFQRHRWL
jgi:magnesium transporter